MRALIIQQFSIRSVQSCKGLSLWNFCTYPKCGEGIALIGPITLRYEW